MKVLYMLIAVFAFSICTSAQSKKVIEWPQIVKDQAYVSDVDGRNVASNSKALEIVAIQVNGKMVAPGQPFSAGDDWLRTFSVKVRNVSDRNISSIRLSFGLPETRSGDKQSGFSLEYGKYLSTGIDYGVQEPVEPGQEVVLVRNDRHYTRDKDGIAKRSGMTDFNTVIMGVSVVKFEDGTVWTSYKLPIASSTARN